MLGARPFALAEGPLFAPCRTPSPQSCSPPASLFSCTTASRASSPSARPFQLVPRPLIRRPRTRSAARARATIAPSWPTSAARRPPPNVRRPLRGHAPRSSRLGGWFSRVLLYIFAPIASAFVNVLLAPGRELAADALAAQNDGGAHDLADALLRLDRASELIDFAASPATEPLYPIDPFVDDGLARMFKTHPPLETRLLRLRELGAAANRNGRELISAEARTNGGPEDQFD